MIYKQRHKTLHSSHIIPSPQVCLDIVHLLIINKTNSIHTLDIQQNLLSQLYNSMKGYAHLKISSQDSLSYVWQ